MIKSILTFFILLFLSGTALPQGSQSVPITQFKQYVEDQTGTLSSEQLSTLRQKLQAFDQQTSTQIIVYMIPSLDGESLEDISMQLAEKNKIGKKDRNNGVLMLVVKDDRKIRIEVGYGLEGALTDALSSQIIKRDITPYFKQNQFYEGINSGVDAIIAVTKGEYTADKKGSGKDDGDGNGIACCFGLPIFVVIIFAFIFISIIGSIIRRIMGFGKGAVFGKRGKSNWFWTGGGFGGGGFGGGSSGGFGGFSGGGGSFGGGGASGSW